MSHLTEKGNAMQVSGLKEHVAVWRIRGAFIASLTGVVPRGHQQGLKSCLDMYIG